MLEMRSLPLECEPLGAGVASPHFGVSGSLDTRAIAHDVSGALTCCSACLNRVALSVAWRWIRRFSTLGAPPTRQKVRDSGELLAHASVVSLKREADATRKRRPLQCFSSWAQQDSNRLP